MLTGWVKIWEIPRITTANVERFLLFAIFFLEYYISKNVLKDGLSDY